MGWVRQAAGRKRHLLVDTLGLVLLVVVTAANMQDRGRVQRDKHCATRRLDEIGVPNVKPPARCEKHRAGHHSNEERPLMRHTNGS
jgi:hypothetical protein